MAVISSSAALWHVELACTLLSTQLLHLAATYFSLLHILGPPCALMVNSLPQLVQHAPGGDTLARISCVDRLPVEILSHIFRLLWHDTAPHPRLDIESWPRYYPVHPSIVYITHVCRRWRELAIGDPAMWKRMYLYLPMWRSDTVGWLKNQTRLPRICSGHDRYARDQEPARPR